MVHIVYCDDKERVLEKILDGTKTMVIRGATGRKSQQGFEGETLYYMKENRKISAMATVASVENYVISRR